MLFDTIKGSACSYSDISTAFLKPYINLEPTFFIGKPYDNLERFFFKPYVNLEPPSFWISSTSSFFTIYGGLFPPWFFLPRVLYTPYYFRLPILIGLYCENPPSINRRLFPRDFLMKLMLRYAIQIFIS